MENTSLGETIRNLRMKAGLSLRELAKRIGVSAPFLSDVELGRRFPGDETVAALATELKVPVEEFKKFDHRESVADFKRILETNPALGMAFRTEVTKLKAGKLTPEELTKKLRAGR
jgi:transcriptional regulator with XRE-family HTH domain